VTQTPLHAGPLGPAVLAATGSDVALAFVELGMIAIALAVLARISRRFGFSPIPAYLLAGLAFGEGGVVSPEVSEGFLEIAAEIGVILLLLTLGLEYTSEELQNGMRRGWKAGLVDLALNFPPGALAALLLGWGPVAAVLLGGITYISSSGVIAKVLGDLGRLGNRETPPVLTVLVIEDLVMALYLPVAAVLIVGGGFWDGAVSVAVALGVAAVVFGAAVRHGHRMTNLLATESDEALLLGVLGVTLLVAGVAQQLNVSAAVGAFLVGIALSGPVQQRASALVAPLRDLFAAMFFVLFSLRIDPGALPPVLVPAVILAVVTALTKVATGWWAATQAGVGRPGRIRAGTALVARGEFSIVIAGLAVGTTVNQDLVAVSAAYVLLLATAGPILTRYADRLLRLPLLRRRAAVPRPAPSGS
jgi:monovalent cation:H+ antiporter-2, CPA2 family